MCLIVSYSFLKWRVALGEESSVSWWICFKGSDPLMRHFVSDKDHGTGQGLPFVLLYVYKSRTKPSLTEELNLIWLNDFFLTPFLFFQDICWIYRQKPTGNSIDKRFRKYSYWILRCQEWNGAAHKLRVNWYLSERECHQFVQFRSIVQPDACPLGCDKLCDSSFYVDSIHLSCIIFLVENVFLLFRNIMCVMCKTFWFIQSCHVNSYLKK